MTGAERAGAARPGGIRALASACAAVAAVACAAVACAPAVPAPRVRVVATAPSGVVPPEDVAVTIAFSAPVSPEGLEDGRFLALCRQADLREVARAAEADGGLQAGAAPSVPATVAIEDGGRRVVLRPRDALAPGGAWAAVLSSRARGEDGRGVLDGEGRVRTVAVLFETGAASDREGPRARWIVPPHGPAPSNLVALRLAFDEPVQGALGLRGAGPVATPLTVDAATLGLDLVGAVPPGLLALELGGVADLAGNPAVPVEPLPISACAAEAPPAFAGPPAVTAATLAVGIDQALAGMGRLVAELSAAPGDEACGSAPPLPAVAQRVGAFPSCPGWDPCAPAATTCPATVRVEGLCPGRTVRLRLASEDLAGHRGAFGAWREVSALPPAAAPVVTEVLADADAPEQGGEYVEVANLGTGPLDPARLVLAKHTASGRATRCRPTLLSGGPVPPGGHALLVGGAYDGRYALPDGAAVYACGGSALAGGLANDRPVAIALEDEAGTVLSSAGVAEQAPRCPVGALERIHPDGPDAAANWACPGTRSPGACNASTPTAECPRRGW